MSSTVRRAFRRRIFSLGFGVLLCLALVGAAAAAPASGGRHLPYFSLLNERVPIKKLPAGMEFSFGRGHGSGLGSPKVSGSAWFGEVERPGSTIIAAGVGHWICETIEREAANGTGTGSGRCTTLAVARELQMLKLSENCHGRQIRVSGLVPNGVTGLEVEKEGGTIERTVPVIENTVDFPVDTKRFVLHGVGNPAAEKLEWRLQIAKLRERRVSNCTVGTFGLTG